MTYSNRVITDLVARDITQSRAGQLEAFLEAVTDGVVAFDDRGHVLVMNTAARRLLALAAKQGTAALPVAKQRRPAQARDEREQPLPEERWVSLHARLLAGETLIGTVTEELRARELGGREVALSVSGSPVRDRHGRIIGSVEILRDVTEQRRLAMQTRAALEALVAMAEELVLAGAATSEDAGQSGDMQRRARGARARASADTVAQRLAEMMQLVTGSRRVGIIAEGPQEYRTRLVAAVGATEKEVEECWRTQGPGRGERLVDLLPPAVVARLERGESIPIDFAQPEFARVPNLFGSRSILLAPMRLGGWLVGHIELDNGQVDHAFTPDELALAAGTAQLAALVLERDRLLREREEAHANELALREANRRMDEFLAVATHELRAPVMASLLGVGLAERRAHKLLDRVPAGESELVSQVDKMQRDLAQAEESVKYLSRLVTDLLDASRTRGGQLDIRLEPTDLAAIVRDSVARQRLMSPSRTIYLHLPVVVPVPMLADADRIGQVVTNYLSNALKYAPEDRPVEVRLQVRSGRAHVSVRDEGPGLPVEEQGHIWERYYQAPGIRASTGTSVGLGLGLYISREIVRAHGGQVGVRSVPGEGSTFWFTLPVASRN